MDDLEQAMLEWVRDHVPPHASEQAEIGAESDLLATGVLDSVGFLDLIAYAEELSGTPIDLMSVDPAHLTSIRGLCLHVREAAGP
jgi:hypothetical protein